MSSSAECDVSCALKGKRNLRWFGQPIFHFSVGPYAIGVTWVLAQAGIVFLLTFGEFMRTER